jgi:hypothetical protein
MEEMMAIANTGIADIVAYYGTSASCVKYRLHPQDWQAAQQAPDAALWSLSAQSGTVIDKSISVANPLFGNPGTAPGFLASAKGEYLEPSLAVNAPSGGHIYPGKS